MSVRRWLLGPLLSEADLAVQAEELLERCRHLANADPQAARRVLRRRARLVQPAFARNEALCEQLVQTLFDLGSACGALAGPRPTPVAVAWEEIRQLADLLARSTGAEALWVRVADGDLVSEVEAVCALAGVPRVSLVVVGKGPPMVVGVRLLEEAAALLPSDLPGPELPRALTGAAARLGHEARWW